MQRWSCGCSRTGKPFCGNDRRIATNGRTVPTIPTGPGDNLAAVGTPQQSRSARRARRHLGALLVVAVTTLAASTGILWLAAHLLLHVPGRGEDEPPMADVVELLKVALVVGLSKWAEVA